jgi:sugar diacid utilization regulator
MVEAVLRGDGLQGVAEIAAVEAGGPVAIVLPARGLVAASTNGRPMDGLVEYVRGRLRGEKGSPPEPVQLEQHVTAGGKQIGSVLLLGAERSTAVDHDELLRTAALASLAEVAVTDARDEVAQELRGGLLEELRAGALDGAEVRRRAARLGCDLVRGAVVLAAEISTSKPRFAAALVESEWQGALAEPLQGRLYAILPASGGDDAPERTQAAAAAICRKLRPHGTAACSSFYPDPGELHDAMREAELVLDAVSRDDRLAEVLQAGAGGGVYRILLRSLVSNPTEVRSFYEDTVAVIVGYDERYRTELLATLEAYLDQDCNMNATARTIYAHRHTVAYRLERIRELTGLDPSVSEDRERLGLGIKAYRIIAPTLPR